MKITVSKQEKSNMTFKTIKSIAIAAAITALASLAPGLSMQPINLGQIVQYTEKAFEGEAVSIEIIQVGNEWADKITFKVIDPVIGPIQPGEIITWNQLRGGEQFPMAGMPQYTPGQKYLIFLAGKAEGSQLQSPIGLGQGSFQVHVDTKSGEKFARNEFRNATLFQNVDMPGLSANIATGPGRSAPSTTGTQRSASALEIQGKLLGGAAGAANLNALKSAAKAFKATQNPAAAYQTATPQPGMSVQITP